jgi:hypothetical protein
MTSRANSSAASFAVRALLLLQWRIHRKADNDARVWKAWQVRSRFEA